MPGRPRSKPRLFRRLRPDIVVPEGRRFWRGLTACIPLSDVIPPYEHVAGANARWLGATTDPVLVDDEHGTGWRLEPGDDPRFRWDSNHYVLTHWTALVVLNVGSWPTSGFAELFENGASNTSGWEIIATGDATSPNNSVIVRISDSGSTTPIGATYATIGTGFVIVGGRRATRPSFGTTEMIQVSDAGVTVHQDHVGGFTPGVDQTLRFGVQSINDGSMTLHALYLWDHFVPDGELIRLWQDPFAPIRTQRLSAVRAPAGFQFLRPATDDSNVDAWQDELGGTTDIWQSIDEPEPPDAADFIRSPV